MFGRYLLALFLTLAIEGTIAYLLGLRTRRALLVVAMINVITHVALNYVLLVFSYLGVGTSLALVIPLELGVVVAEWQMLAYALREPQSRFLTISIVANTTSFLVGLLLFWR